MVSKGYGGVALPKKNGTTPTYININTLALDLLPCVLPSNNAATQTHQNKRMFLSSCSYLAAGTKVPIALASP